MERFNSIYLFTTENIAGYMKDLNLHNKKVITVTGSGDHIINAVLKGARKITTFDVNPLTKYYLDLKLAAIKDLSLDEFKELLLYENKNSFAYEVIKKLDMNKESKKFWLDSLEKFNQSGLLLRKSALFNTKYFDASRKIKENLYLNEENYAIVKDNLKDVDIEFIEKNIKDLELNEEYDYMFLSNVSDYLKDIYKENYLDKYQKLISKFKVKVKNIYFAYVYDFGNDSSRSDIDKFDLVVEKFGKIKKIEVSTALIPDNNRKDAVMIIEGGNKNGK